MITNTFCSLCLNAWLPLDGQAKICQILTHPRYGQHRLHSLVLAQAGAQEWELLVRHRGEVAVVLAHNGVDLLLKVVIHLALYIDSVHKCYVVSLGETNPDLQSDEMIDTRGLTEKRGPCTILIFYEQLVLWILNVIERWCFD